MEMSLLRRLYECSLVLVRPDQHIAWRGNALPEDTDGLLRRVSWPLAGCADRTRPGCCVPYDYIGSKIESLLRAREVMELLVSTSAPEEAQ